MVRGNGIIILLGLIIGLASCKEVKTAKYSEFEHIGNDGWNPARILSFMPIPVDTMLPADTHYSLVLTLRYTSDCQVTVLPIRVSEQNEDGEYSSQIRKLCLRDKAGTPIGRKGLALYELSDTLKRNFELPENYWVELESLVPAEYTKGIYDVGLELIEE